MRNSSNSRVEPNKLMKNMIELENDKSELLGLATYFNKESTVSSYTTIFDILWLKWEFATSK